MESVEDLWLSGNKISSFDQIEPISHLGSREGACLETIYLEYNPVANEFDYRKKLASMIPSLKQIDADMINSLPRFKIEQATTKSVLKDSSTLIGSNFEATMKEKQNAAIELAIKQSSLKDENSS